MKAVRVEKQGGPEVLKLLDVAPLGAPGPGQAVVRLVAAGVNFLDVGQRRGTYPRQVPFTLGVVPPYPFNWHCWPPESVLRGPWKTRESLQRPLPACRSAHSPPPFTPTS